MAEIRLDERQGTRAEDFLRIEEGAQRLLDELTELKKETESYRLASRSLQQAAQQIGGLTKRLEDVTTGVREAATALREIGTPELLKEQRELASTISEVVAQVEELRRAVGTQAESTARSIAELQQTVTQQVSTTGGAIKAAAEQLAAQEATASELHAVRDAVSQQGLANQLALRTLRWIALGAVPVLSAVLSVVAVRLLGG